MATALLMTFQPYDSTPETIVTMDVSSTSFGVEQGDAPEGEGKVSFGRLTFMKKPDVHSAELWSRVCSGAALQKVMVTASRGQGDGDKKDGDKKDGDKKDGEKKATEADKPFVVFMMGRVMVKSISFAASDKEGPMETVTLEYRQAAYSVTPQYPDGSSGQPVGAGWNRETNAAMPPSQVGS